MRHTSIVNRAIGYSVALFLMLAALLKLNQQSDLAWYVESTTGSYFLNLIGIFVDVLLASLLVSGIKRKLDERFALFVFQ